ncbi:unnamed protein product [Mycena citricolor]|uniref:Rhamnolipids biosynthesis 3-oxoacyl-[acyl-carrier-protein] reductase n=1 Tax=Mycena citricolor TaxID=2018698 RepID=A0AAD2K543_9AGAR|nr:unnamed protein product [Mycena citricolor]
MTRGRLYMYVESFLSADHFLLVRTRETRENQVSRVRVPCQVLDHCRPGPPVYISPVRARNDVISGARAFPCLLLNIVFSPSTHPSMSDDLSVPSLFNVKGKTVLVTGGSVGIGFMMAKGFASNGAKVFIAARKEGQLKEAVNELKKVASAGMEPEYIVANVASKAGCDALIAAFKARSSNLHVLINNSGITWGGPYENFPEEKGWDNIFNVNVKSIFYMTSGLTDCLTKDATSTDPGRVINISSVASLDPHSEGELSDAGNGTWSCKSCGGVKVCMWRTNCSDSKTSPVKLQVMALADPVPRPNYPGPVNHLTSVLAVKLASQLVTVNAILPGVYPSKMTAFGFRTSGDKLVAGQPMGRVGAPSDIAGLAVFLASPAAAHITGQHIVTDGGSRLQPRAKGPSAKL